LFIVTLRSPTMPDTPYGPNNRREYPDLDPERMAWETLTQQDRDLDDGIALAILNGEHHDATPT
jgi:hypothetical protein